MRERKKSERSRRIIHILLLFKVIFSSAYGVWCSFQIFYCHPRGQSLNASTRNGKNAASRWNLRLKVTTPYYSLMVELKRRKIKQHRFSTSVSTLHLLIPCDDTLFVSCCFLLLFRSCFFFEIRRNVQLFFLARKKASNTTILFYSILVGLTTQMCQCQYVSDSSYSYKLFLSRLLK